MATAPIKIAGRAVDFANYTAIPSPNQIDCLKDLGFGLGIVGASFSEYSTGSGTLHNWPHRQLTALKDSGMKRHAYSWLKHPFSQYRHLFDTAFQQIAGTGVEMMWVDVEDSPTANMTTVEQRVNDIWQALDYWKNARPDLLLGIYTGDWWWDQYMPGVRETFGKPLWMAAYVLDEGELAGKVAIADNVLRHYIPGGWKPEDVWIWQYMGDVSTCGLNTDRNIILEAGRMKYTDEVLDKAFGAILKDLGVKGGQIVALGKGLGTVAQDLYTHIQNNGDFTQAQGVILEGLQTEIEANTALIEKLVEEMKAAGVAFDA